MLRLVLSPGAVFFLFDVKVVTKNEMVKLKFHDIANTRYHIAPAGYDVNFF